MNTTATSTYEQALSHTRERPARTGSGYLMLFVLLLTLAMIGVGGWQMAMGSIPLGIALLALGTIAFLFILAASICCSPIRRRRSSVRRLSGDRRTNGLRWVLPG